MDHLIGPDAAVRLAQKAEALGPGWRVAEARRRRPFVGVKRHEMQSEERDVVQRQARLGHVPVDDAHELL